MDRIKFSDWLLNRRKHNVQQTALHIVRGCLLLLIVVINSCGEESEDNPISVRERNIWLDTGMRPPEPVIVDAPASISDLRLPDSIMLISVFENEIKVIHAKDTTVCSLSSLDSLIVIKGATQFDGKIALKAESSNAEMINEIISILERNKIMRFNLITDLEK
jgi:hypothetical protein